MLAKLIKKITGDKKNSVVKHEVYEVESALKKKPIHDVQKKPHDPQKIGGSVGFMGTSGYPGTNGFIGDNSTSGPGTIKTVIIEEYREPTYPRGDAYSTYPAVMFHTTEWINKEYLVPIGKSKHTGYPIYRYTSNGPDLLNKSGHNWEELI